jgi:hypothetical protein
MQNSSGEFMPATGTGSTSTCAPSSGLSVKWNSAVLAAVFLVGTGGFATPQALNCVPGGPGVVQIAHQLGNSAPDGQHVVDTQEKLAGIRRYLSLNVSNLAKVLRVGRPTVYSWLRDDLTLRANHARRIDQVYRFARMWRALSNQPIGEFLVHPGSSGKTIFELLSAKSIDDATIRSTFAEIADAVNRRTRRASVIEIAKRRGFKLAASRPVTNWNSRDEIDV